MLTVNPAVGTMCGVERRTKRLVASWLTTYRSDNTRDAYERDMVTFVRWCAETGRDPLQTSPADLDAYRDEALATGASAATVTRRLSGIASFFRYASEHGAVGANPADEVDRPEADSAAPATLDDDELASLLDASDTLGPKAAALVALLALEGLKLGEVLAIDVPRVRVERRTVAIEVSRRGDDEDVEVASRTAAAVTAYIGGRRRGPLFLGDSPVATSKARLSRFGADFIVKRTGATAGIDKPVSASILRRTYIESQHRAGTPLADIAQHVGHRETRDTARLLEDAG
jgi:site-specific recombinase XerD